MTKAKKKVPTAATTATLEELITNLGFGRFQIKNYVLISAMMFFHPFQIFIIPFIGNNGNDGYGNGNGSLGLVRSKDKNVYNNCNTNENLQQISNSSKDNSFSSYNLTSNLSPGLAIFNSSNSPTYEEGNLINVSIQKVRLLRRGEQQKPVEKAIFYDLEKVIDGFVPHGQKNNDEKKFGNNSSIIKVFLEMLNPNRTIDECLLKALKSKSKFTIVDQWNLTGSRDYMVPLASSIFMFGSIFGSFIFAIASDHYGRRPSLCASVSLHAVSSVMPAIYSPNYVVFVVYRFLQGVSHSGNFMSHMVMLTELLPADKKFIITAVSTFFYTAGHVMLAVFAYFLVNWKHLQLLTGLVSCVYLFFLYFIDESIYWLMAKYKTRKAAKLIVKAARVNHLMHGRGKSYFSYQHVFGSLKKEIERSHHGAIPNIIKNPQDENEALTKNGQGKSLEDRLLNTERSNDIIDLESSHQNNSKKRYWNVVKKRFNAKSGPKKMDVDQKAIANTYNETFSYLYPGNKHLKFLDLVMMPLLRKRTFFAALGTFFLYQLQMALILSIHLLPGDQYINFSLSGLAEIPINIIGLYALSIGRRKPLILFNTITAIAIITRWKIPTNPTLTSNIISISLYLIARSFNGGAFLITFLYISEIYPTEIRNSGYGLNNAISRAGYVIAPFITYLEKYHKAYFPMLMVSFSILSSLFIAYLPATKNKPLPKTMQDLE